MIFVLFSELNKTKIRLFVFLLLSPPNVEELTINDLQK